MQKFRIKIADYFIIGSIIIIGLVGLWFNLQEASAAEQKYATVHLKNEQVAELSLSPGESYAYELSFGEGNQHTAEIEVADGRVRMLPMGEELCPQAICSHTGWIEHSYESIVCLPNQIMINLKELSPVETDDDVDGITY